MKKILSKRKLRKIATKLKHKEERKVNRLNKRIAKQQYKQWSDFIKDRANWCCEICGKYYGDKDNSMGYQGMHILSKENYPELKLDTNNGLAGCFYCHKNAPISSHHDGFAFAIWLMINRPSQFNYLKDFLLYKGKVYEKRNNQNAETQH